MNDTKYHLMNGTMYHLMNDLMYQPLYHSLNGIISFIKWYIVPFFKSHFK
jgi:hypothetical protein